VVLRLVSVNRKYTKLLRPEPSRRGRYRIDELMGTYVRVMRPTAQDRASGLYFQHECPERIADNTTEGGER
jgi:hypothetical protein